MPGPLVAKGYWQDPERTAERFKPAPAGSAYGGMAVWSGDRVRRDEAGPALFRRPRGRDDQDLGQPGQPDRGRGGGDRLGPGRRSGGARLSRRSGWGRGSRSIVRPDRRGEEEALRAFLKRQLPNFMQPGPIIWRDELPRSPNGKLDRVALKNELMA